MHSTLRWFAATPICLAALASTTGCSDPLTREHFELIKVHHDTTTDVEHLLGKPTTRMQDQWHYQRLDRHVEVFVDFDRSRVVTRKQWIDAESNEWYDSADTGAEPKPRYERTEIRTIDDD